jgi:flagellar biosynthesis/type III secretory pathway chaperone
MDPLRLNQLLAIMEEQTKFMGDLTALSKKKSVVLVDGNLNELDILLRGEQALVWQLGRLEERRFQMQTEVAAQMGIHPSQLTLEKLLTAVPEGFDERCRVVAQQYGDTALELTQVNQLNTELIQQAMAYVDFSLQLLGGRGPGGQVYSPTGQRGPQDGKLRRLDNRV